MYLADGVFHSAPSSAGFFCRSCSARCRWGGWSLAGYPEEPLVGLVATLVKGGSPEPLVISGPPRSKEIRPRDIPRIHAGMGPIGCWWRFGARLKCLFIKFIYIEALGFEVREFRRVRNRCV